VANSSCRIKELAVAVGGALFCGLRGNPSNSHSGAIPKSLDIGAGNPNGG